MQRYVTHQPVKYIQMSYMCISYHSSKWYLDNIITNWSALSRALGSALKHALLLLSAHVDCWEWDEGGSKQYSSAIAVEISDLTHLKTQRRGLTRSSFVQILSISNTYCISWSWTVFEDFIIPMCGSWASAMTVACNGHVSMDAKCCDKELRAWREAPCQQLTWRRWQEDIWDLAVSQSWCNHTFLQNENVASLFELSTAWKPVPRCDVRLSICLSHSSVVTCEMLGFFVNCEVAKRDFSRLLVGINHVPA